MTREQAKAILPIMQAFAEGKTIQFRVCKDRWIDIDDPSFDVQFNYRIKPEPKYRPFKTKEECFSEMLKHQPFGWVKDKDGHNILVLSFGNDRDLDYWFATFTFIDGTPFGIKEE